MEKSFRDGRCPGITGRGVAQRLAHLVRDQGVGGSNPLTPTMDIRSICFNKASIGAWRSLVAQLHGVQKVAGSNPAAPTIFTHLAGEPLLNSGFSFIKARITGRPKSQKVPQTFQKSDNFTFLSR